MKWKVFDMEYTTSDVCIQMIYFCILFILYMVKKKRDFSKCSLFDHVLSYNTSILQDSQLELHMGLTWTKLFVLRISACPKWCVFKCGGSIFIFSMLQCDWLTCSSRRIHINFFLLFTFQKNTYTFMSDVKTSMPVFYEMMGFDSLIGSHFDKYYVTYTKVIMPQTFTSKDFQPPSGKCSC